MLTHLRPAVVLLALFTLMTGVLYPLGIAGIAQLAMPAAANGSMVETGGRIVGSSLIGQSFTSPRYFHGRPSAAGTAGYDPSAPSGSNPRPPSKALAERIAGDVQKARTEDGIAGPVPADLVTASGSGLDPDISPAAAFAQTARVARERGLAESDVRALVERSVEPRLFGLLGEPTVNVLALNMALDGLKT